KGKAQVSEHIVTAGETLWKISQLYGIRLHSLKAKNRLYRDADLQPGMILKLRDYRKRNEPVAYAQPPQRNLVKVPDPQYVAVKDEQRSATVSQPSPSSNPRSATPTQPQVEYIDHRVQQGDTL